MWVVCMGGDGEENEVISIRIMVRIRVKKMVMGGC